MKRTHLLCALAAAVALNAHVHAQDYPAKQIRIVLPFSPGGGTDLLARLLSKRFYEVWGQVVTVDNRPGGSTVIGAQAVARAAIEHVPVDCIVGVGTGSTANFFIDELAKGKAMDRILRGS